MKKSLIICMLVGLATVSFSQSTTSSTNPKQAAADAKSKKNATGGGLATGATDPARQEKTSKPGTAGQKSNSSANPQAGTGTSSGTDVRAKSAGSKAQGAATVSQGAINKSDADATVKKGSGSSPKNRKNQTGKTGNYKNEETKKNGNN